MTNPLDDNGVEAAVPGAVLDRYEQMLPSEIPARCEPSPGTSSGHLKWMLGELRTMGDEAKAMRWLGFIQRSVVLEGYTTVEAERDFTRPFFTRAPLASSHTAVEPVGELVELVERLRKRAESEREIQRNNEAVAAALSGQIEAFDRHDGSHNTFAVRLALDHQSCAKNDADLARDWDEAASALTAQAAALVAAENRAEAAEAEVATLKGRVADLEAGLKPLASLAWQESALPADEYIIASFANQGITAGDARRARRLTPEEKSNGR